MNDRLLLVKTERMSEAWMWQLLGLISPIVILFGNLVGDFWVLAGPLLVLGIYPLLDLATGVSPFGRSCQPAIRQLQWLLYAHVLLVFVVVASLCWRALEDGNAWITWAAVLGTGINTGVSGLIVAHELGHRRPRSVLWWLGRLNLLLAFYLHFTVEHNRHHHAMVATTEDPASAPQGRGLWGHLVRTIPLQLKGAWRLGSSGGRTSLRNPILHGIIIQVMLVTALWQGLSGWVALAFLGQAVGSIFLLEYVNYIQHYGLRREVGARQSTMDSWQSDVRWSRWTLLELTRHPAHHMKPGLPFWELISYAEAPTLPTGYYGLFWICLFPPLWRRWIDPLIPG